MHIPPHDNHNRPIIDVDDSRVPLNYFNIVKLSAGQTFSYQVPGYETAVVPATGTVDVDVEGDRFSRIGQRGSDVWDGEPEGVYAPSGAKVQIICSSDKAEVFVAGARFDGVEWAIGLKLLSFLDVKAQYTYLDWDTADGKLRRRPRHRGGVNFNISQGGLNVNLNASFVGSRDDFRAAAPFGDIIQPGYGVVDLASSYTLPWQLRALKDVTLFGKIANLFDKKYEEADGFRARPLNFLLGVRGTFGG